MQVAPHNCSGSLRATCAPSKWTEATHAPIKWTPYEYATLLALSLLGMLLSTVLMLNQMLYRSAYSVVRCARSVASVARASLPSLPENVRRNLTWRPQVHDLFERVFGDTSGQARAYRCSDRHRRSWRKHGRKSVLFKLRLAKNKNIYSCVRKATGRFASGEHSISALRQRALQQYEHLPGMKQECAEDKLRAYDCHTSENASPRELGVAGLVRRSCSRNRWRRWLLLGIAVVLTAFMILRYGGLSNVKGGATEVGGVMPGGGIDTSRAMSPVSTIRSRVVAASSTTMTPATVTVPIKQKADTHRPTYLYDCAIAEVQDMNGGHCSREANATWPETAAFVVALYSLGVYVLAVWGVVRGIIKRPRGRRPAFSRGLSIAATSIVVFACLGAQPCGCSATMLADTTQSVAEQTTGPMPFHQNAVDALHVS